MKKIVLSLVVFLSSVSSLSQEKNKNSAPVVDDEIRFEENLKNLDYPELQVVPRASERLSSEAAIERDQKYLTVWPLITAASATLVSANTLYTGKYRDSAMTEKEKKDSDNAALLGFAVGSTWLATSIYMSYRDPLSESNSRIQKLARGSKKADLYRERLAEEVLQEQAEFAKKVTRLSVLTNVLVNLQIYGYSNQDYRQVAGAGAVLSLLPLLFEHHSMTAWEKHQEYRRRIYTPMVSFQIKNDKVTPLLVTSWTF